MKRLLLLIVFIGSSNLCFANGYRVDTVIDQFIIREGDTVFAELEIRPHSKNWIIDSSGRSKVYSDGCIESSASIWIHAKVEGFGLKEIGPFHVKIGNETIKSTPLKVYVLPKLNEAQDFVVLGKRDPNGKDLFQIKIEYKIRMEKGVVGPIDLNHDSLPKGVQLKSGGSGYGAGTWPL